MNVGARRASRLLLVAGVGACVGREAPTPVAATTRSSRAAPINVTDLDALIAYLGALPQPVSMESEARMCGGG